MRLAVLFALALPLCATNYYVRTGGNDACNGTVDADGASGSCAKKTIQAGVNLAFAGDTVTVHSGTYNTVTPIFSSARAGSSGNLITVKGAAGETATVTSITITHNYVAVQNFNVTGSGAFSSAGISLQGGNDQATGNIIVGNCQPWNAGEGCNTGVYSSGASNIISNNVFDGVSNGTTTSFGIGIYLADTSTSNTISGNLLKDVESPGRLFEIYGSGHTISQNEVKHCQNTFENGNVHVDVIQMFDNSSSNIVWERNYIHDFQGQFFMFADNANPGAIHDWTIRNNVYANVASSAFIKSQNIKFYNNTFYRVGQSANNAIIFSTDSEGNGINGVFENNILIPNATNECFSVQTDTTTLDHNYYANTSYGARSCPETPYNETGVVNGGNPLFTAAFTDCTGNVCDFHIASGSVVKNVGATIAAVANDYAGVSRPQGGTYDIGAYEYTTGSGVVRYGPRTSAGPKTRVAQ